MMTLDSLIGRDLRVVFFVNRDTVLAADAHSPEGEHDLCYEG